MKEKPRLWTRDELTVAFNLYLKLPFGKLDARTPEIIELAKLLNRTSGSISMRLNNFASVDPFHRQRGVIGLTGGKKQVQPIWDEFIDNKDELLFESERILAEKERTTLEKKYSQTFKDTRHLKGEDKKREIKVRINQKVFRQIVVANYECKCAITQIDIPDLLVASHIVPWSKNEQERLNPENGICLSALYDCAFDKGLIGINHKYEILLSRTLKNKAKENYYRKFFAPLNGVKISIPKKYYPKKEFLIFHLDTIFKG